MNKIILTLIIGLLTLSCSNNKKEIKGDLYFKLIDIGSYYGLDVESIERFEKSLDSIRLNKTAEKGEQEIIRIFDILKANDLQKSPWINLKTESDIIKIYLTEKEYLKLKNYDRNDLIKNNKKVNLEIKVSELDSGIYYSDKIKEIKLVDGRTYWRK